MLSEPSEPSNKPLLAVPPPSSASGGGGAPSASTHVQFSRRRRARLLGGSYLVLFARYCIATFLSSFFPQCATRLAISDTFNGLIFAAYPLGMALTSIFAPQAIQRLGTRAAAMAGLGATSLLTVVFGLGPDLAPMPALQYLFLVAYLLNGLLGALAETACIILVSSAFRESPGAIMASINTVCTLGCMLGPVLGGLLYDFGASLGPGWSFRMPFVVCSAVPLLLLPLVPAFMPQLHISEAPPSTTAQADAEAAQAAQVGPSTPSAADALARPDASCGMQPPAAPAGGGGGATSARDAAPGVPNAPQPAAAAAAAAAPTSAWVLLSPSITLGMLSIALSGTFVGTLDPTLSMRLSAAPFRYSPTAISLCFFFSSLVRAPSVRPRKSRAYT